MLAGATTRIYMRVYAFLWLEIVRLRYLGLGARTELSAARLRLWPIPWNNAYTGEPGPLEFWFPGFGFRSREEEALGECFVAVHVLAKTWMRSLTKPRTPKAIRVAQTLCKHLLEVASGDTPQAFHVSSD